MIFEFDILSGILDYIDKITFSVFIATFWYFIIVEFTRYAFLDFLILIYDFLMRDEDNIIRQKARNELYKEKPLVSVIAPGKNEGKHIPALSESLRRQTYKNLEIIIVDDGSDDDTAEICQQLLKEKKINNFFSNPERGGKASAANTALQFCNGKFVVHLDADSHINDDSIENIILNFYIDPLIGGVAGDVRINNVEDSVSTILQGIEYLKTITISRYVSSKLNILRIISGAYGAFRTDVLRQLGGWDVGPGLDGDITVKIRKLGYKTVFDINAVCYTNSPVTFAALAKQRYRWDRSLVRFRLRKHINVYSATNKNFDFALFITLVDGVLYNFVFNYLWWGYLFFLIFYTPENFFYILVINYFLYLITNIFQFSVVYAMVHKSFRPKDYDMVLFIPLLPFYNGIFLRVIRTYAQLMEILFKISYEDKWNPWKVSRVAKEKGL